MTSGQNVSPFGYSGEYTDSETGLQYLRARYYDPEIGRFTQEDFWLDQGPNLYIYCGNDPVNYVDPSGHWRDAGNNNWVMENGDTLWGLARQLTGNGANWTKIGYTGNTNTMRTGTVINVSGMIGGGSSGGGGSAPKTQPGGGNSGGGSSGGGSIPILPTPLSPQPVIFDIITEQITYYYNASKALSYAAAWWNKRNPNFKANDSDCANFVSQCLYAGGFQMDVSVWIGNNKHLSDAWGLADDLYFYLNSMAGPRSIVLNQNDLIAKLALPFSMFRPGDVLFFAHYSERNNADRGVYHAALAGTITKNDIFYFGHSQDRNGFETFINSINNTTVAGITRGDTYVIVFHMSFTKQRIYYPVPRIHYI